VGSSTSHNPVRLHGLLRGIALLFNVLIIRNKKRNWHDLNVLLLTGAPTTAHPALRDGYPQHTAIHCSQLTISLHQSPSDDISGLHTFCAGGTTEGRGILKYKTSLIIYKEFPELDLLPSFGHTQDGSLYVEVIKRYGATCSAKHGLPTKPVAATSILLHE
jgi:hypothetical protein